MEAKSSAVIETKPLPVTHPRPLTGQVALVTGGCRGIGRAISMSLASDGAHVVINCRSGSDCQHATKTAAEIRSFGDSASLHQADVGLRDQVDGMKEIILSRHKKVDILVNNAGILMDKSFAKMDMDAWQQVLSVNLNGVFNCTKAFIETMLDQTFGRIVNITSIVGQTGNFGQANYAAAKAGIIGLTKTLSKEVARKGITVNAVSPGFIDTDMLSGIPNEMRERLLAAIPMARFGRPEEVARVVRFLVTEGDYITGQVIGINGGLYV
jgi:NAD(P)-dependent dehydrogenase (short-subunit alcohol dehydrogenase family)